MVATRPLRYNWKRARKIRRAKRKLERVFWTKDTGYGMGQRFYYSEVSEETYHKISEVLGVLESIARKLEGRKV